MKQLISCEFNIDTACVELKYSDGSMIAINCAAVEDEVANSCFQRSELDWLIYNDPLSYAELILNGDPKEYFEPSQRYHRQILIDRQSRQRHIQGMMLPAAFNVLLIIMRIYCVALTLFLTFRKVKNGVQENLDSR